jgi:excisionase family DNA binding protein
MSTKKSNLSVVETPQTMTEKDESLIYPLAVGLDDAAKMVGIGRTNIWRLTMAGEIPSFNIGRRKLILVEKLKAWLLEQAESQAV